MRLKASLSRYAERSRLAIWLVVIICLITAFMLIWRKVEREANQSAFLLASQSIVERASFYKQQWLLAGQISPIRLQGEVLNYTNMGWVKPLDDGLQVNCQWWLQVLYPQYEVLGSTPVEIENKSNAANYQCEYLYGSDRVISISLIDNRFIAKSGFLAR